MTWDREVEAFSVDQLADALSVGAEGAKWSEQAAVGLLVAHGMWLGRPEFRRAVGAYRDGEGVLRAWVDWSEVDHNALASSSERGMLALACSLGGVASEWSLASLLGSLDERNAGRVLRAVAVACYGPDTVAARLWLGL